MYPPNFNSLLVSRGMTITLPVWLALAVAILATLGVYDRVMRPSWRWLLRNRANRVLDQVAGKLKIEVRPFQRTRRQALIDVLVYDVKVQEAAAAQAAAQNMPRALATQKVREYASEIVPAFNAYFYFRIGYWLARRAAQALYRVRVGYSDDEGLARVPPNATVVFVMNHRSNMDYVLTAYLAADRAALSYAVGEWARIWPLQQLIRAMGGYFVRRGSGDDLYRRVLERYIAMATENGVTQALYPEGGLTRDGLMREPRLGVLDYMLRGFDPHADHDVVFIPLGINYDRTLEDRTLLLDRERDGPRPGVLGAAWTTLRFVGQQIVLMARSRWMRFGYACVNFGTPISVREWAAARDLDFRRLSKEDRFARIGELARRVMDEIGRLVPVLPVPLIATVFARNPGRGLAELEIKAEAERLIEALEARGAKIYVPRADRDYAISAGLEMLTLRHVVDDVDGLYTVRADEARLIAYYANSIAHLLPGSAVHGQSA
jgi:glycerol-3-phosphate O-acyltransferase